MIEEQLDGLAGYKYFCSLDLASSYYQIRMNTDSIPKTAFITQDGHYEFRKVPFGLTNTPVVFQRIINKILANFRFTKVLVYLDNILIPGKTIQETMELLKFVLDLPNHHNLQLKLSKCFFFHTEIQFLGYEISNSTIKPTNDKIVAVEQFPVPLNIHQVRHLPSYGVFS